MTVNELNYIDGIDKEQFINYIFEKYNPVPGAVLNNQALTIIENIIDYGCKHKRTTKDSLIYFIGDLLPDLELYEIAAFIDDDLLTDNGRALKNQFWNEYGKPKEPKEYYYYFDCLDGLIGDSYLTASEINKLITGAADPMSEKDIIKTAANYEATLYRYEKANGGGMVNEIILYDVGF